MRYMVIVKASEQSEQGVMGSTEEFAEMAAYNEELSKAGLLLAAEGLTPSSEGARVQFRSDGGSTVVDGPFPEVKELLAGFWILQVDSREEVMDWVRRAPFRDGEVEVRRVAEFDDLGPTFTAELREQEERIRANAAQQQA